MRPGVAFLVFSAALLRMAPAQEKNDADSPLVADFNRRVADYIAQHKSVMAEVHRLKPTKSPETIEIHEHEFSRKMHAARHGVPQGNIFTNEIAAEIRSRIEAAMQGPEAARIRASLRHAEPVRLPELKVNGAYPKWVPLQSTPPSLLLSLPKLPAELEYRFVGSSLVLRDIEANLIVDLMPNAIH